MRFTRIESEETRMTKKIINGSELADMKFEVQEDGTLKQIVKGKYLPKYGERYYYVNIYGLTNYADSDDDADDHWLFNHKLVFRTKEECEEYRKFLDLLDEYTFEPDWKDLSKNKYYLVYKAEDDEVRVDIAHRYKISPYHFESLGKLDEFIEKAREHNIKRFMFDIWD